MFNKLILLALLILPFEALGSYEPQTLQAGISEIAGTLGSCTVTTQRSQAGGSWITGCTYNAIGSYTIGFTGSFFSGAPLCNVSVKGGTLIMPMLSTTPTTSAVTVLLFSTLFAAVNGTIFLDCH